LRIYIARHAEAESGEQLDPTRELTDTGKAQATLIGKWLKRQTTRPEVVIQSNMKRSRQTAKRIAAKLGVDRVDAMHGAIDPDSTPERALAEINRIGKAAKAECVIAVAHGPLVEEIVAYLTGGDVAQVHFPHAAVAHIGEDDGLLHWLVTPNVIARDEDEAALVGIREVGAVEAELIAATEALADLLEARGDYYYDDVTLKRWVLGDGGRTGNCEACVENADAGEIEESEPFPADSQYGPVVEPPAHDNCACTVEYRDTVRRVYV